MWNESFLFFLFISLCFVLHQVVQWWRICLPMQENSLGMRVWSLCWVDPLEEEMATHSSILAWRIPRTKEPGSFKSMGSQRVGSDWSNLVCMHVRSCMLKGVTKKLSVQTQYSLCNPPGIPAPAWRAASLSFIANKEMLSCEETHFLLPSKIHQ